MRGVGASRLPRFSSPAGPATQGPFRCEASADRPSHPRRDFGSATCRAVMLNSPSIAAPAPEDLVGSADWSDLSGVVRSRPSDERAKCAASPSPERCGCAAGSPTHPLPDAPEAKWFQACSRHFGAYMETTALLRCFHFPRLERASVSAPAALRRHAGTPTSSKSRNQCCDSRRVADHASRFRRDPKVRRRRSSLKRIALRADGLCVAASHIAHRSAVTVRCVRTPLSNSPIQQAEVAWSGPIWP